MSSNDSTPASSNASQSQSRPEIPSDQDVEPTQSPELDSKLRSHSSISGTTSACTDELQVAEGQNPAATQEALHCESSDLNEAYSSKKVRGWHRGLLLAALLVTVGYSVGWPYLKHVNSSQEKPAPFRPASMPLDQAIHVNSMKAFAVIWILCLGSTVGSFLNVLVYRMPRGKSVIFTPSRCPKCNSNIRPTDNIPVFGWLRLEGKCRSCSSPISARYPTIEAITALLFLALFAVELVSGGANIPLRVANIHNGIVAILFELRWDLIQIFLYHCVIVCLSLSWILIDIDRQRVTWLAIMVCVLTLVIPTIIWPHLQPVSFLPGKAIYPQSHSEAVITSLVGGFAGLAMGLLLTAIYREPRTDSLLSKSTASETLASDSSIVDEIVTASDSPDSIAHVDEAEEKNPKTGAVQTTDAYSPSAKSCARVQDYAIEPSPRNLISLLVFVGLACGWQSTVVLVAMALTLRILSWLPMSLASYRLPLSLFVGTAVLVQIACWKPLYLWSERTWLGSTVGCGWVVLILLGLAWINRIISHPIRTVDEIG